MTQQRLSESEVDAAMDGAASNAIERSAPASGNGSALAKGGAQTPATQFKAFLAAQAPRIAEAIPPGSSMTAEQVITLCGLAAMRNPDLMTCTPASILQSVVAAASLGLNVSGVNGEAHLIPYKRVCQLIPGWRGLVKLARRNPDILILESRAVYPGDEFEVDYGTNARIVHKPGDDHGDDERAITHVYAIARMANGERVFEVMTRAQVDRVKKDQPVWRSHYGEMARKTVLRRLCKHLPVPDDFDRALAIEDNPDAAAYLATHAKPVKAPTTNDDLLSEIEGSDQ